MTASSRSGVVMVYDGACAFCVRSLRLFRAFDLFGRLQFFDGSDAQRALAAFPELAGADLASAMYAVADGRSYRGFDAFRRAMWVSPILAALAPLMYLPGIRPLGMRIYGWVARNRHAFGCSSGACRP